MGELSKWARENSEFLKVAENEAVHVIYLGFKIVPSRFDPKKEKVQYRVEVGGQEKLFESSASGVALAFDAIKEGSEVLIGRTGTGNNTKYTIELIPQRKKEDVEPEEIPD